MTFPQSPAKPVRYVRDRVTDARRTPRPGGTQPESERKRPSRGIRLGAAAWLALDALAASWGVTRSAVVERLVLGAATG